MTKIFRAVISCLSSISCIYPRIVPEEVYRIVRGLAAENKNGTHLPEVCYLLKDKLVCGYCGRPIASESGTARNGETIRYYKCSGRKKLQDCNKATIGKEVLESLVVDTTLQVLNDPDTVELLAERLMAAHKKRIADQTVANLLAEEKQELQKSIDNVLSAIDKGIFTASTKKHLEDLESRMEVLEARLLEENAKSRTQMQKEDIKRFIFKAIKKEPKQMIKLLVHHIVLYDDKIEIYYNFTDTKKPDDFEHQAFLIYTGEWEYATNDPAYRETGCVDERNDLKRLRNLLNKVEFYNNYSYAYAVSISYKLRIMGLAFVDDGKGDLSALEEALPEWEDVLVAQENERWCCYMRTQGWRELPVAEVRDGVYQDKVRKLHARLAPENVDRLSEAVGRDFRKEDRDNVYRLTSVIRLANSMTDRPYSVAKAVKTNRQ